MKKMSSSSKATLGVGLMLMTILGQCYEDYGVLRPGYYHERCSEDVEAIIERVVEDAFARRNYRSIAAALLRMQFHDCAVRGCDASVLLDGKDTEKTAKPNLSLRGFDIIDDAKRAVESVCPGVVSCADIIAISTRVAVFLSQGDWYEVETGRLDGRISNATEAANTLPSPSIPVPQALSLFASWGLTSEEFVVLLGGHTVGMAHCVNFQSRLYNYKGTGKADPIIKSDYLTRLQVRCPKTGSGNSFAVLDPESPSIVDNGFYISIEAREGVLQIDQDIATDDETKYFVQNYATNRTAFDVDFGKAMIKLGRVGVITDRRGGEIRQSCRSVLPS